MSQRARPARPEGCCPLRPVRALPAAQRQSQVALFKALADPTRLEILRLVAAQDGPTCVCDIVDHFDLSQPTISHHLKVLREAGLLSQQKLGIWAFYAVRQGAAERLASVAKIVGSAPGAAPSRAAVRA